MIFSKALPIAVKLYVRYNENVSNHLRQMCLPKRWYARFFEQEKFALKLLAWFLDNSGKLVPRPLIRKRLLSCHGG